MSSRSITIDSWDDTKPWREERKKMTMADRLQDCFEAVQLVNSIFSYCKTNSPTTPKGDQYPINFSNNPLEKERFLELWKILQSAGLSPVIGGSIAAMSHSYGRATKDVDFNLPGDESTVKILQEIVKNRDFVSPNPIPVIDGKSGKNDIPVKFSSIKFKGLPVDIYYNTNFASQYAIQNQVPFRCFDTDLKVIPPESVCGFKIGVAKRTSKRYHKDAADVQAILAAVDDSLLQKIDDYVGMLIERVQGPNSEQMEIWRELVQIERNSRESHNRNDEN
eukprot:TRINITY_DN1022_c0_g1_i1.p1 TRINITY_DN1022_c0_g1~~TRINITY_DN1022_c0_g1_i1.p1  ORF type:complete len:302 (-),score=16.97 TRINITY_DN1022_c0_g1_i1:46-879(-)